MDNAAVQDAAAQIEAFPWPDLAAVAGPVPPAGDPTEDDLREATEQAIAYEDALAAANAQIQALNDLYARMNFDLPTGYETAVEVAKDKFTAWADYRDLVQQALVLWSEARAKIEHDLEWQAYERQTYGVKSAPRGRAGGRPLLRITACSSR